MQERKYNNIDSDSEDTEAVESTESVEDAEVYFFYSV